MWPPKKAMKVCRATDVPVASLEVDDALSFHIPPPLSCRREKIQLLTRQTLFLPNSARATRNP
jgi:hypothetical protein